MRLPLVPPEQLTDEQQPLYDRNRRQMDASFTSFTTVDSGGALLGPWGVFLHEPTVGQANYDLVDAITGLGRLPVPLQQVAILAVGARYKAAYEMYAHAAVAASHGLDERKIAALCAGVRPADLTTEEASAFDVTSALLDGGVLPEPTYRAARDLLGQPALNELVFWIAHYTSISITLNAFDVTIPSNEHS